MSDLATLVAQVDRKLFAFSTLSLSVVVADATGSQTLVRGPAAAGRPFSEKALRRTFEKIAARAHPGAVLTVTAEGAEVFAIAAPGGAFDGRATDGPPARAEGVTSPAVDSAAVAPGDTLSAPSRAVFVGSTGALAVTMAGGLDVTFPNVPAGFMMPIQVVAILPATTAGGLVALF